MPAEAGVVGWVEQEQERLISQVFGLARVEPPEFLKLLSRARAAKPLIEIYLMVDC